MKYRSRAHERTAPRPANTNSSDAKPEAQSDLR